MRLGVYGMPVDREGLDYVVEAERLGVDSVWVPEFWGYDALTGLGAIAALTDTIKLGTAIVQLDTRTPAMLAMSAMSLQQLSGGRFLLGVGASGPQVMEGWHGVPFAKPVRRTRETIEIIRMITAGERLVYDGEMYQLPLPGGEGKALRAAAPPVHVPVYIASLGPANLRLTGAVADGWIGNSFFCETADVFFDEITNRLVDGGRVELRGFGAFSTRSREARQGRNPRTGESVEVEEKWVPFFKTGKLLRDRLNGNS